MFSKLWYKIGYALKNGVNVKDYPDNNPVELGWYDWNTINATTFQVYLKSDKSREMYGFRLQWESETGTGANCTNVCDSKNCTIANSKEAVVVYYTSMPLMYPPKLKNVWRQGRYAKNTKFCVKKYKIFC